MTITLNIHTVIFAIIMVFFIYKIFKKNDNEGNYFDFSGFENLFWFVLAIIFVLIYGGIYFW